MHDVKSHETWSSRLVFLLAAVGAAVGLGNIWKFPYTAGVSGGGAFVLIYLLSVVAVAVPIVMVELLIGRRGRQSPINSMRSMALAAGASPAWRWVGWLNVLAGFLILSFYSVIAGWALAYVPRLATGEFSGADAALVNGSFNGLLASPGLMTFWHALFMGLTVFIVARGVHAGIESAVRFLMPSLFVMLLVLVGYAAYAGDLWQAVVFLFHFDFSLITPGVVLNAVGQSFFSVSVAMGLLMTYGAYLPQTVSIPRSALIIALCDTLVAILAGLAIFPLVFANGLDPAEGPGLIFVTLPLAFGSMPAGAIFGSVFFVLLVFAALTSSIAILNPLVTWAEEHQGASRRVVTILGGIAAWGVGLVTVFSFNIWGDVQPLGFVARFEGKTLFDLIDYLTSNIMLPLGGILLALFAGWIMSREDTRDELGLGESTAFALWRITVRFVAPAAIAGVLVYQLTQ